VGEGCQIAAASDGHWRPDTANASAIRTASDTVSAYEMFVVTATAIPRSGKVMSDAMFPPIDNVPS
jgi:hypothetical protein